MSKIDRRQFLTTASGILGSSLLPETVLAYGSIGASRRYRVALLQGTEVPQHAFYLQAIARHLMQQKWLELQSFTYDETTPVQTYWHWLASLKSPHIEFVTEPMFVQHCNVPENSDKSLTDSALTPMAQVNEYLDSGGHIDLLLAFGIDSEKALTEVSQRLPVLAVSVEDYVANYLLDDLGLRDVQNFYLHEHPTKLVRNIALFDDVVGFSNLGIMHDNLSKALRTATTQAATAVAKQLDVNIEHCFVAHACADVDKEFLDCCEKTMKFVDALYIQPQPGFNERTVPTLVEMARDSRVPTCCEGNEKLVRQGILMCTTSTHTFQASIEQLTANIQSILHHKSGQKIIIEQAREYQFHLNMRTAEAIGVYLSADILAAADQIYVDFDID